MAFPKREERRGTDAVRVFERDVWSAAELRWICKELICRGREEAVTGQQEAAKEEVASCQQHYDGQQAVKRIVSDASSYLSPVISVTCPAGNPPSSAASNPSSSVLMVCHPGSDAGLSPP